MASEHWGLWLAALLGLIGFGGLVALDVEHGSLRGAQVPSTIGWYLVAFAGYVVAVWWNEGHGIPWRWLWLIPVVFRLLMLSTAPTLSDDVHRYLWDGHLVSQGVNPYANVIDDPALDPYTIDAREEANNPQLSSPYLPTAHAVFGAVALVLPSEPWTMQLAMTLFDLAAAALLAILLPRVGLDRSRVLVYLWNPLVIVEIAHGAHLDALMVALTLGSLVLTLDPRGGGRRSARIGAPLLLALATLTRPIPALLLPVLFWRWSWPQRLLYGVTCVVVVVPFGLRPGFGLVGEPEGTGVFGSARVYAETFRFNSSIYHWFEQWVLGRGLDDRGWNEPLALTRLVLGASVAGVLLAVWWVGRGVGGHHPVGRSGIGGRRGGLSPVGRELASLRLMVVPIAAYSLLTPVLHPWYVLILVVLMVFLTPTGDESRWRWLLLVPWWYLTATLVFSYLTYRDPEAFAELEWVRRLQWLPTLASLAAVAGWSLVCRRSVGAPMSTGTGCGGSSRDGRRR